LENKVLNTVVLGNLRTRQPTLVLFQVYIKWKSPKHQPYTQQTTTYCKKHPTQNH